MPDFADVMTYVALTGLFFYILYLVVRAAVRDGIRAAGKTSTKHHDGSDSADQEETSFILHFNTPFPKYRKALQIWPSFYVLYLVVRAAVRDGIRAAGRTPTKHHDESDPAA